MRNVLSAICIFFSYSFCFAQSNLQGTYYYENIFKISQRPDSTILVFDAPKNDTLHIHHLNLNWKEIQNKKIALPLSSQLVGLTATNDGAYALVGMYLLCNNTPKRPFILKLDKCINYQWIVGDIGYPDGIVSTKDSSLIVNGLVTPTVCSSPGFCIPLTKFDYNGNKIDCNLIVQDSISQLRILDLYNQGLSAADDSSFTVSGQFKSPNPSPAGVTGAIGNNYVINFDLNYNQGYKLRIGYVGTTLEKAYIIKGENYLAYHYNENVGFSPIRCPALLKLNAAGTIQWDRKYENMQPVAVSAKLNDKLFFLGTSKSKIPMILALDELGNITDSVYINSSANTFTSVYALQVAVDGKLEAILECKDANGKNVLEIYRYDAKLSPAAPRFYPSPNPEIISNCKSKPGKQLIRPFITSGINKLCKGSYILCNAMNADTYEWYLNGNLLSANGSNISVDTSGFYSVITTTKGIRQVSPQLYIQVFPLPKPMINLVGSSTFCSNTPSQLIADSGYTYYKWLHNGYPHNSIGNNNIILKDSESGSYSVQVTDNNRCTNTSNSISVQIFKVSEPIINSIKLCDGTNQLYLSQSLPANTYTWYNGDTLKYVSTTSSYVVNTPGKYHVKITDANSCKYSSANIININKKYLAFISYSTNTLFCSTSKTYQWLVNGQNIAGAIQQVYIPTISGTYTCEVSDYVECTYHTNKIEVDLNAIGINNLIQANIKLYPNPASNTLQLSELSEYFKVKITNIQGREQRYKVEKNKPLTLDISELNSGLYLLSIQNNQGTRYFKFVVNK